ncbi:MAG: ABC transporter permease [Ignavibacteriaceae bacterium]
MKGYIKLALRQLRLFKTYSLINISGLAIGLAACFIIYVYVSYQLSFDDYNKNIKSLNLVYLEQFVPHVSSALTPLILGPTLKEQFPEIKDFARWKYIRGELKINNSSVDDGIIAADPNLFKVLTLPLKYGEIQSFINNKNSLIISESSAKKYFGERNPIGKSIMLIHSRGNFVLNVVAVMKDIPKNSSFVADFIVPISIWENISDKIDASLPKGSFTEWDFPSVNTYLLLSDLTERTAFQKKLTKFSNNSEHRMGGYKVLYHLILVKDIYYYSSFLQDNYFLVGSISNVYIYASVAFLILIISVITFLMLSIGRVSLRYKEYGIRKVIGASKIDFLKQNIIESLTINLLALPLAIFLVEIFLPEISSLIGERVTDNFYYHWKYFIAFWSVSVFIGITAGIYISFYVYKQRPVEIIRNKLSLGKKRTVFRKIMIGLQTVIFTVLIFCSIIIYDQLNYLLNRDPGFNKKGLVVLYPDNKDIGNSFQAFKNELKRNPDVLSVSGANLLPGTDSQTLTSYPNKQNPTEMIEAENLYADKDYIETLGMKMIAGKTFLQSKLSDSSKVCIINETAAHEFGFANPVGQMISDMQIIGVVKDFNIHSLYKKIIPVVIKKSPDYIREIAVRISNNNRAGTLAYVEKISKEFNQGTAMDYKFMSDRLGSFYNDERNFAKIIGLFTFITIFVASLGLFGMSLFVINQRTKEIGIRKVLGATIANVYFTVTKEFFLVTALSVVIAFPIAYYFITNWLQNFAYRISINIWIFILGSFIAILIVFMTVSFQAIKITSNNPIKSIRIE